MIDTIVGTVVAGVTVTITGLRRNANSKASTRKAKGEPGGSPFAVLHCRLGSALKARMFPERRAPQKRCD
jgi:hypothetical protein